MQIKLPVRTIRLMKIQKCIKTIAVSILFSSIIYCGNSPSESDLIENSGEFTLLSIEPPLNSTLTACDTITAKFTYNLPDDFVTNDTTFTFYLEFRSDTIIVKDNVIYDPTRCADGCNAESSKWLDTMIIRCPAVKLFDLSIQKKPVEMSISMISSRECPDSIGTSHICLIGIEYPQKYYYSLDMDSSECTEHAGQ